MTATAQHVAEITEAIEHRGTKRVYLGAYDSRFDGAEIRTGDPCEDCGGAGRIAVGRDHANEELFDACGNCSGLGRELGLYLSPHDCHVTFAEGAIEEEVLALVVFADEILNSKFHVSDPVVVAEHCEDWRDEQHLRELVRYWSSRLAVEENEVSEHDLAEAAWGELGFADGALLLPQHQRAAKLRAAALLLLGVDDQLAEDAHERAQDALEEGR